ncbi:PaaI family thioesterase [soil metagenome]
MTLLERLAEAKRTNNLGAMVRAIPYANLLGLEAEVGESGELVTTMKFSPALIGDAQMPAIHGGSIGALLESAAVFELLWRAETIVLPKTITLTVDYLRSAGPHDVHATSVISRHGRRIANVRIEAWQADRNQAIATAHAIFLVMRD